jgi:signal transduction histidine kinase
MARQRFLTSLGIETDRLLALCESLLTLQDSPVTESTNLHESFALQDLTVAVVEESRSMATASGVSIDLTPANPVGHLYGDLMRMHQVFANLMSNAIAHAPAGSTVRIVSTITSEDVLTVDVIDQGKGIAEADRERVFDRFVRLDRARSRASGGAGLGLAIVRSIVIAHGGTVCLLSGPNGVGTTARVELPHVE